MILMGLKTLIDHGERRSDANICYDLLFNGPQVCPDFICTTTIFTVFDLNDLRMKLMYDTSATELIDTVLQNPDRHVGKMSSNAYCVQVDHL